MAAEALNTAVIFLIFNRPAQTTQVFEQIRRARPPKLLVVADGPRHDRPDEAERCAAARRAAQQVDWPCELLTRFSETNLGCRKSVSSGLDWAFEQVDQAIILEDDCLPDATFFRFCEELLGRYREEPRVAQICGSNYQRGQRRTAFSYYFSRHAHIWGWATWRRSWTQRDLGMSAWPELRRRGWLRDYVGDGKAAFYWTKLFDDSYSRSADSLNSWAIPWTFSCWQRRAVSIIPETNLVANIGYSEAGTHTAEDGTANRSSVSPMEFPLRHPPELVVNAAADRFTEETFYYGETVAERIFWALRLPFSVATVRRARRIMKKLAKS